MERAKKTRAMTHSQPYDTQYALGSCDHSYCATTVLVTLLFVVRR